MDFDFAFVFASAIATVAVAFLLLNLYRVIIAVWWRPLHVRRAFQRQGVHCLPYRLLLGNLREVLAMSEAARSAPLPLGSNNIGPRIFPHYYKWMKEYGNPFVFWLGYRAVLSVPDPEHIREILSNKFGHYRRFVGRPEAGDLIGDNSIGILEGERWAKHRRIINPAFFAEKLKAMSPTIVACITATLDRWESQAYSNDKFSCGKEIDVLEEFKSLTANIIAHTAFGSSYEEGKLVFQRQQEQQVSLAKLGTSIYIPGSSYLPTARNRYRWRLKREIQSRLLRLIQNRAEDTAGNDLLGVLLAAGRKELPGTQRNLSLSLQEIVDDCKNFFFAGHETTATLMTWIIMLLAIHQEWQERTREEVLSICGKKLSPDDESLNSLQIVNMVINESLRLYPPLGSLLRQTVKEMKLGRLLVPPGTLLFMPLMALHHDPTIWGQDALEFNPERFAHGIANACKKTPLAFLPFGMGPRNCVGQNFALLEARLILVMMLQRFRFSLSSGYQHAPITVITIQPQHGMHITLEKII